MHSIKKILIKNTSWLAISETVSMIILFGTTVIIARVLGDTIYGQFAFIIAFAQLWLVISDFGLTIISVKEFSTNKDKLEKYLSNFLGIKLIISLITFILILLTIQFINKPDFIKNLIYVAGGYVIFYTASDFLRSLFKAYENFKLDAFVKISQHILLLILIIIAARNHSLSQITWSYFYTALYGTIVSLIIIKNKFVKLSISFDKNLIKYFIKQAMPMALANVFVIIYFRIDTIMLSFMKSDEVTGWYNAAYLLIFSLSFFAYVIMMSIYPKLSNLAKKSLLQTKILYRKSLYLIALAGILILGISSLIVKHLIPMLYGNEFLPAINIFYILTIAVFFSYLANVWLYTLNALGKQKIYTIATAIGLIVNLSLNFLLIPKYSYFGAAWATVATEIIAGLIIFVACEQIFKKGIIKT